MRGDRGDGRIFKPKNSNKIHCAVCVDGVERRWSSGSESEDEARRQLKRAVAQIRCGLFTDPNEQRLKFEDLARSLADYYMVNGKASLTSLPYFLKPLRAVFGTDRARRITDDRVMTYTADRLRDGARPATINKELGVLKRMFALAVDAKRLSKSSVPTIKLLPENNVRRGFVDPADFIRLREALPDYLHDPGLVPVLFGLGVGEMRSLEWRDIERDAEKRPTAVTSAPRTRRIVVHAPTHSLASCSKSSSAPPTHGGSIAHSCSITTESGSPTSANPGSRRVKRRDSSVSSSTISGVAVSETPSGRASVTLL
jgi:hypothetical protein